LGSAANSKASRGFKHKLGSGRLDIRAPDDVL